MIRTTPVLVQCEVEAYNEAWAACEAQDLAIEDAKASKWVVDHDAFDRARDDSREPDDYRDAADEALDVELHEPKERL